MLQLSRNGLRLQSLTSLDESQGSSNVKVSIQNDGTYTNYSTQLHYGYYVHGFSYTKGIARYENGVFILPREAFEQYGLLNLSVLLVSSDEELMTNQVQFIVQAAPRGDMVIDDIPSAQQQVLQLVQTTLDQYANTINLNKNEIAVLKTRMDSFTQLQEGSTTGDAELIDGRVGYDGKTYKNIGGAIRGQVSQLSDDVFNVANGKSEISPELINNKYIDYETGAVNNISSAPYKITDKIKIPKHVTKIECNSKYVSSGNAGWATYSSDSGISTEVYIRGGQTNIIEVTDDDKYIAFTTYDTTSISVIFYFGKKYDEIENEINYLKDSIENIMDEKIVDLNVTNKVYVDYNDGGIKSTLNTNVYCTGKIKLPENVTMIITDCEIDLSGNAGWATYSSDSGISTEVYIRGGQTKIVELKDDDKAIAFTTYSINPIKSIKVTFIYGVNKQVYINKYPFYNKIIGFTGDSITFGANPNYSSTDEESNERLEIPFPKRVGEILNVSTINYGVNSGSLMDGLTGGGTQTPMALVNEYVKYRDVDIFVFMIGINDLYRGYPLGDIEDRTNDTFYGALHNLILGLTTKYSSDKHKILMMIYPTYYGSSEDIRRRTPLFFGALKEVAEYYSLPVLELDKCLGINVFSDIDHEYWVTKTNSHPTQKCADLIAKVIANYINSNFKY